MTCPRCRARYEESSGSCPRCGAANTETRGTFQTSTVLIGSRAGDRVYRSVQEVPASLRTLLLKSTNGANSDTILIADRRGRAEVARAMRKLPGNAQRRLRRAIHGEDSPGGLAGWLTPGRRMAILAVVGVLALAAIVVVFTRAW